MPRPKIKLPYSQPEKLIQIISAVALLALIGLTVYGMISLPERIPSHFGFDGRPDTWGGKGSLLLLPILTIVIYTGTTILERFPWAFNYAVEITKENAPYQYKLGRQLLEVIKLIVALIFLYLQWQTLQQARGLSDGLGAWFLPVCILALFGSLGLGIYKMVRHK